MKKMNINQKVEVEHFSEQGVFLSPISAVISTYLLYPALVGAPQVIKPQLSFEEWALGCKIIGDLRAAMKADQEEILLEKTEHEFMVRLLKAYVVEAKVMSPGAYKYISEFEKAEDIKVAVKS